MDWVAIGTGVSALTLVYFMIRNFKSDMYDNFKMLNARLDSISKDIVDIKVQIGKLETRVDERTLRVHYPRTGTKEKAP